MRFALAAVVVQGILVAGIVGKAAGLAAQQKAPIPDGKAQEAVRKAAEEVYGERFRQAKAATAKTALAKEILDAAVKVKDGSTDQ